METQTTPSLGELVAELRSIKDRKDGLNAELSGLNKREDEIEYAIMDTLTAAGLAKATTDAGTVSKSTKWRAKYDPEKWADIFKWAAARDRTDLIQRRTSDAKIMELVDAGEALPDGLTVESFEQISFRRS
jgi:hypothetical protein